MQLKFKIPRIINTGPHFQVAVQLYENYDHEITPDIPPQPGVNIYAISKALGQEICEVFTEKNEFIFLQTLLFYNFYDEELLKPNDKKGDDNTGKDLTPFSVRWEDAAEALKLALEIELNKLSTRSEKYFIFADSPLTINFQIKGKRTTQLVTKI